jgi:hypothetical protein
VTSGQLALRRVEQRLVARLEELDGRLEAGVPAAWAEYCEIARTLAAIAPATVPGAGGEMLTTRQMAAQLAVHPRTLLRKKREGMVTPAIQLGRRGRGALRWRADQVAR